MFKISDLHLKDPETTASPLSRGKLCATRWLTRVAAIFALKEQYQTTLQALKELVESNASVNTRVAGLLRQLSRSNTYISFYKQKTIL